MIIYCWCVCSLFDLSASVNPNGNSCPTALRLIACVLLLEITTFMRETYKNLPKMHRPAFFPSNTTRMTEPRASTYGAASAGISGGSANAAGAWNSFDQPRSNSQAVVPHLVPATSSSSRRWSMATQSVGNASISSSCGGGHQPQKEVLEKQASIQSQVPPETMAALVANTSSNPSGEGRKISFVLQDNENESKTSSQTTLAMQVDRKPIALERISDGFFSSALSLFVSFSPKLLLYICIL